MTSQRQQLNIVQLYPEAMNIYGDNGNVQVVSRRAELYGYQVHLSQYNSIADLDNLLAADMVLGGGGQDSGQRAILADLQRVRPNLLALAEDKVPMLMICGLYQLFGHYFQTKDGDRLDGIGLFDITTVGGAKRLIGNAIIHNDQLGDLIGYENHSGVTTLGYDQATLGQVVAGYGNDGLGVNEGAIRYMAIGTYLHGPILSKNPRLADWLISSAVERRYGSPAKLRAAGESARIKLAALDKAIDRARDIARSRPQT